MENEELIRQDMERTRESITEKLETLENKVVSSVQQASSAVTDTVANVKDTMHEGVEKVKDAFDVKAHVDRHPWLMLGGAIMAGYALGTLLRRTEERRPVSSDLPVAPPPRLPMRPGNGHHKAKERRTEPSQTAQQAEPEQSGIMKMLEPELQKLKGLALGFAMGAVREAVTADMPPHLAEQVKGIMDAVTEKVGGNPVPSDDLPFMKPEGASAQARQDLPTFESDTPRW
jgi:ElaB/YqjD/DUF883 family membrane-anchored ribosome-binding protein